LNKPTLLLFLFFFFLTVNTSFAQDQFSNPSSNEFAKIFEMDHELPVKLKYSQDDLRKNTKDSIYTVSSIAYQVSDDQWDTLDVKLEARGNFRRENCYFPPVMIKIKKSDAKETAFKGHKKLKLVLPCFDRKDGNDDVIKEFIAYKLFEVISPYHFKTQMLQVDFDDTNDKKEEHYSLAGFVIEDDKKIAKREGAKLIKRDINPKGMEVITSIRCNLFMYMIGNVDYSTGYQHNCKLLYLDGKIIPIPYDFDMCGFVDPVYGVLPNLEGESLGISNIKQRVYRGFKRDEESFQTVRQEFLSKKVEMLQVLRSFEADFSNPKEYARAEKYILSFFEILENDKKFKRNIILDARDR
jgi:hypothetical protein